MVAWGQTLLFLPCSSSSLGRRGGPGCREVFCALHCSPGGSWGSVPEWDIRDWDHDFLGQDSRLKPGICPDVRITPGEKARGHTALVQPFSTVGLHRFSSWQFWGSIYTEEEWQSLLKAPVTSQSGLSDTKLHRAIVPSGKYTRPGRDHNNVKENEKLESCYNFFIWKEKGFKVDSQILLVYLY